MNWYFEAWQRYAQFSGRASREAFWMCFLVPAIGTVILLILLALPSEFQDSANHYLQHDRAL